MMTKRKTSKPTAEKTVRGIRRATRRKYSAEEKIRIVMVGMRAEEQLRAIASTKHDAGLLDIEVGAPLLEIRRTALTLDGSPIELRTSRCNTSKHYYENTVF